MFDKEEKELMELGERIKNVSKPNSIDEYIKNGIKLGKKEKRRIKVKSFVSVAAVLAFMILVTSIRVSPAFAQYISNVPGLEYIVKLINYDKGVKDAVDNNFVQHINASQEHEDLIFTIKDIIMDKSKAIIFYSIENKGNHKFVNLSEMKFMDEKGKELVASKDWGSFINADMNKEKKLEGSVELNFHEETIIPDMLYISVTLREGEESNLPMDKEKILASTWEFQIPVDKQKLESMQKVYTLNQTIEIENQKIIFKTVTVTPIRIAVEVEYDKNNSKKILRFDDISIVDEKGEKWGTISNGVSGTRKDDNNEILYFQSNYFTEPKELYIKASSIRALDKDKLMVIVDTDSMKLLKAPDDRLTLNSVNKNVEGICLEFNLIKDKIMDEKYVYSVFDSRFKANDGITYNQKSESSGSSGDSNKQSIDYILSSDIKLSSPIYLTILDYPTRIKGEFKIKIK